MNIINFCHDTNLITVSWNAVMDAAAAREYVATGRRRVLEERFQAGYRLLLNLEQAPFQSPEAIDIIAAGFRHFPRASRIAVVTTHGLARIQIRRLLSRSKPVFFATPDEALGWLLRPDEQAAA